MEVNFGIFCDAATVDAAGKTNILGIFDTITVQQYPAVHPKMALVLSISVDSVETGQHSLKISFVDAQGEDILPPLEGTVEIQHGQSSLPMVLDMNQVEFRHEGTCAASIIIDGVQLKTVPLNVRKVQ